MNYYRLLDVQHKDMIVRANGAEQYLFVDGAWQRNGILLHYFSEDSPLYDLYEEITEKEAMEFVAAQSQGTGTKGA